MFPSDKCQVETPDTMLNKYTIPFLNIEQGTPILDFRNNYGFIENSLFIIR